MTAKEEKLVGEALQYYHLEKPKITFIRHNENITCRVTDCGKHYALRIREPVEGFSLKLLAPDSSKNLASGETELLLYLSRTAPFPVQKPVQNRLGEYNTLLSDGISAELLQWLDGTPLAEEHMEQYINELGTLAAQINAAAKGFTGERIVYSHELVKRIKGEFAEANERAHLNARQTAICCDVLEEIEHIMTILDEQPDSYCLIHADLSCGNIIITPDGLAPIDFSLSGFGYRAQECGMLAAGYKQEYAREAVRISYEKASGIKIPRHHMKAFDLFSILLFIALQHDRYWAEPWFQDSLIRWTGTEFPALWNES